MSLSPRVGAGATVLVLVLGGCATPGDVQSLRTSVQARFDSVQAGQDSLRAEIHRLREDLLAREEEQTELTRGRASELERRMSELQTRIARLAELTGQTRRFLRQEMSSFMEQSREMLGSGSGPAPDTVAAEAEREAGADTAGPPGGQPPEGEAPGPPADTAAFSSAGPEELYRAGLQQFRRGAYRTARIAFVEFVERFPQHDLGADAQYYLGESLAEIGDTAAALKEYSRILELYPNSERAPAALYKRGRIQLERGNVGEARSAFEQIVRGFPDSPEADLAEDQLNRIGSG